MAPARAAWLAALAVAWTGCGSVTGGGAAASPARAAAAAAVRSPEEICSAAELLRAGSVESRALLAAPEAGVRGRAAIAAGRTADVAAIVAIAPLLQEAGDTGATAAWALGRIPGGEAALLACLGAPVCPSAAASARALGSGPRGPAVVPALIAALTNGGHPERSAAEVEEAAALALGVHARTGGKGADVAVAANAAVLIDRLAAPNATVGLVGGKSVSEPTLGPTPALERGLTYTLGRIPKIANALMPALQAALDRTLASRDPETAALAARAWGRHGLPAARLRPLLIAGGAVASTDWRVQVEAARALAQAEGGAAIVVEALTAALGVPSLPASERPVLPAVRAHALVALYEAAAQLKLDPELFPHTANLSSPAATVAVRCAAALQHDQHAGRLIAVPRCGAGLEPDWRAGMRTAVLAGELAKEPASPDGKLLLAALGDSDARVRNAAAGVAGPAFAPQLRGLLEDQDPVVIGSAAASLAKDPAAAKASLEAAAAAVSRLAKARSSGAGDPRADALAALAELLAAGGAGASTPAVGVAAGAPGAPAAAAGASPAAGAPAPASAPPPSPLALSSLQSLLPVTSPALHRALGDALKALGHPPLGPPPAPALPAEAQAGLPAHAPRPQRLVLTTSAGVLKIHLHGGDGAAPLTSAALAALAGGGFYDKLTWHRVVPDFVAQGGDPRGDGEGGPGWALPDEHTPLPFLRGTLGIATSGPETGGSQIFLCHSAQPHLDGRYTVAGELEEGGEVLDALQVGDTILHAAVE